VSFARGGSESPPSAPILNDIVFCVYVEILNVRGNLVVEFLSFSYRNFLMVFLLGNPHQVVS